MRRITSALFLDFDNIFSGLLALDREAAFALAERPGRLLVPVADVTADDSADFPSSTETAATSLPLELDGTPEEAEARAHEALAVLMAEAPDPVLLANTGHALHRAAGSEAVRTTHWFGCKTLSGFIKASNPELRVRSNLVWDPSHHDTPDLEAHPEVDAPDLDPPGTTMPAFITDVCDATDMPRLPSASWAASFEALGEYAATHTFALTEATAWTRDLLAERGCAVGRQALSFIIRGCLYASVRLDADPPPTAADLRDAFLGSITERARSAGVEPTDADPELLERWLAGEGAMAAAPTGAIGAR